MQLWELMALSVGLAMDAFAVSICKGLARGETSVRGGIIVAVWFGGFQALMPAIGFFAGSRFQEQIEAVDHWIAFALLAFIGLNMIREAFSKGEEESRAFSVDLGWRVMLLLALATSIDALAVGVSLALLQAKLLLSIAFIGSITAVISFAGFQVGAISGAKHKKAAQIAGGVILVAIGCKVLLEHLL